MLIIEITDIQIQEENSSAPKSSMSEKAAIISRMAKMGQSILPKMPLPSTTDSEDTEVLVFSIIPTNIHEISNKTYEIIVLI